MTTTPQYTQVYGTPQTTNVVVSNTAAKTTLWSQPVTGGDLGLDKRIRAVGVGIFSKTTGSILTINLEYGSSVIAFAVIDVSVAQVDVPFIIDALLSAKGDQAQDGQIEVIVGTPDADLGANHIRLGGGALTFNSTGDSDLKITVQFGSASASDEITGEHFVAEIMAFSPQVAVPAEPVPNTLLYSIAKVCKLPYTDQKDLFSSMVFYAELMHHLTFWGLGGNDATFTRNSTDTAVWRDQASHAVAIDQPRFEYDSNDQPLGIKIHKATEDLTFPSVNALHTLVPGVGTLIWVQEGVAKSTSSGDTNPFNSSGLYTGTDDVHTKHVIGFKPELSAADNLLIKALMERAD